MVGALIITGPSGVGKTTIADRVASELGLRRAVTATTRAPRPGEVDGVDYHFVSGPVFAALIETGELVEHQEVYPGVFYGLPASELIEGTVVVMDTEGAAVVATSGRPVTAVFVRPPSLDALAVRLRARATGDDVATRMRKAEAEMAGSHRFRRHVVNDDLDRAVAAVRAVAEALSE